MQHLRCIMPICVLDGSHISGDAMTTTISEASGQDRQHRESACVSGLSLRKESRMAWWRLPTQRVCECQQKSDVISYLALCHFCSCHCFLSSCLFHLSKSPLSFKSHCKASSYASQRSSCVALFILWFPADLSVPPTPKDHKHLEGIIFILSFPCHEIYTMPCTKYFSSNNIQQTNE